MYEIGVITGRKPVIKEKIPLAPRPATLKGKTIALYHNDKVASFPVMATIKMLLESLGPKEIFEVHAKTPFSRHPDSAVEQALRADAVFTGTGD